MYFFILCFICITLCILYYFMYFVFCLFFTIPSYWNIILLLYVLSLSLSTIFLLDLRTDLTVWYCLSYSVVLFVLQCCIVCLTVLYCLSYSVVLFVFHFILDLRRHVLYLLHNFLCMLLPCCDLIGRLLDWFIVV